MTTVENDTASTVPLVSAQAARNRKTKASLSRALRRDKFEEVLDLRSFDDGGNLTRVNIRREKAVFSS